MEIVSVVLHKIEKEAKKDVAITIKPRPSLFNNADAVVVRLIDNAVSAFRKTSSRGYAIFQKDVSAYPFSSDLGAYLKGDSQFMDFSTNAMGLLKKEIGKEILATGGYILFCHYKLAESNFILVMQLKIKPGTGVDDATLDVKENFNLDIDNLHEAARINVENWRDAQGKYISFVKKASNSQPTRYFRDFIGCDEFEDAKEHTKELVKAIELYCEMRALSVEQTNSVKERVFEYCEEKKREGQLVTLSALSTRINEQEPEDFIKFIDDSGLVVPDNFDPIKDAYKHLKRIGGKDKDLAINFNRALVGKRIHYDRDSGYLTIKALPADLKAELDEMTTPAPAPTSTTSLATA